MARRLVGTVLCTVIGAALFSSTIVVDEAQIGSPSGIRVSLYVLLWVKYVVLSMLEGTVCRLLIHSSCSVFVCIARIGVSSTTQVKMSGLPEIMPQDITDVS
jgi:hypothetical protein